MAAKTNPSTVASSGPPTVSSSVTTRPLRIADEKKNWPTTGQPIFELVARLRVSMPEMNSTTTVEIHRSGCRRLCLGTSSCASSPDGKTIKRGRVIPGGRLRLHRVLVPSPGCSVTKVIVGVPAHSTKVMANSGHSSSASRASSAYSSTGASTTREDLRHSSSASR